MTPTPCRTKITAKHRWTTEISKSTTNDELRASAGSDLHRAIAAGEGADRRVENRGSENWASHLRNSGYTDAPTLGFAGVASRFAETGERPVRREALWAVVVLTTPTLSLFNPGKAGAG